MGDIREQPASPVLFDYRARPAAPCERSRKLGAHRGSDEPGAPAGRERTLPPKPEDFDDEVRSHLELLADRYMRQGMSRADAIREARLQFGNPATLAEARADLSRCATLEALWRDVRVGFRGL